MGVEQGYAREKRQLITPLKGSSKMLKIPISTITSGICERN